jgi:hypothetical protein
MAKSKKSAVVYFCLAGSVCREAGRYMMESCLGSPSHSQTVNTSKRALFLPAVTTVMIPCKCGQGSTVTALENSRRRKVRTALLWVITYTYTHTHTQARVTHREEHTTQQAQTPPSGRQQRLYRRWRLAMGGLELKPSNAGAIVRYILR